MGRIFFAWLHPAHGPFGGDDGGAHGRQRQANGAALRIFRPVHADDRRAFGDPVTLDQHAPRLFGKGRMESGRAGFRSHDTQPQGFEVTCLYLLQHGGL